VSDWNNLITASEQRSYSDFAISDRFPYLNQTLSIISWSLAVGCLRLTFFVF
jgi:hypothetical protein